MNRFVQGGVAVIAGIGLAAGAWGCSCDSGIDPNAVDAERVRADADLDAVGGDDAFTERPDANNDTGPSTGFDAGGGMALDCRHSHSFGEDFWYLARDTGTSVPSFTSVAGRAGTLVGVYSTSDTTGARRIEAFRFVVGAGGRDPVVLAGATGGSLPSIVASADGFWVTFVVGTDIRLARYSADLTAIGAPITVGSDTVNTPPRVATTPSGGYVLWVTGTTIRGRMIDASGAATGAPTTLVTGAAPIQQASLQRVGGGEQLAVSWADGGRPHVARLTGGVLGTPEYVAGDVGIFTSIDMGGQSAGTMAGLPLAGATVYDLDDLGARDVVFRVLDDTFTPNFPAATVGHGGDFAWSASVEPFLTGYALAYRARLPGVARTALRIGYLDREGCRLGSVTDRFVVGLIDSDTGAVPQLGVDGNTMLIVWSDELAGEYFDYFASVMTCTERS